MSSVDQIMKALESKGSEQTRKIFARHGATGNFYGVKVADLKTIAKTIKGEQELARELYATGNFDAMYLAGIVADGTQMTRPQLQSWVRAAEWQMISEYTVPWVASESKHGHTLATRWITAKKEHVAAAGWSTLAGIVTTTPDDQLDLAEIKTLLKRVESEIDGAPLARQAKATAKKLGKVEVDMNGTACKVPVALDYIEKMGRAGKKRKTIRC